MTRWSRRLGVLAATCGCAVGWLIPPACARSGGPPANLLVYAQEWTLYASRATVPAGRIAVQLWNRGQDAHDLRVRRLGPAGMYGPVDGAVRTTDSGRISAATWRLTPGRYELYCSLPGHMAAGMHATLTVA